jgi:hypothetical protein
MKRWQIWLIVSLGFLVIAVADFRYHVHFAICALAGAAIGGLVAWLNKCSSHKL